MLDVVPKNEEFRFEEGVIISQTTLDGTVSFVNRNFCKISAYEKDEFIGLNSRTLFHPDMPKIIFSKMFESINGGHLWNGIVKNLRKDGLYYWSRLEILPIKNSDEEITGFISVAKPASLKSIQESSELYNKMLQTQE